MGKCKDLKFEMGKNCDGQLTGSEHLQNSRACWVFGVFLVCSVQYLGEKWHQNALCERGKKQKQCDALSNVLIGNQTTYLNTAANKVHPFLATAFPISSGFFQQDNAVSHFS